MSLWLQAGYGYEFVLSREERELYNEWRDDDASTPFYKKASDGYYQNEPCIVVEDGECWFFFARFENLDGIDSHEIMGLDPHQFQVSDEFAFKVDQAFEEFLADPETPTIFAKRSNWVRRQLILSASS